MTPRVSPRPTVHHATTGFAWVIGCWFILQALFNDVGNLLFIPIGFNLRPDRLFLPVVLAVFVVDRRRRGGPRVRLHPAEWCMLLLLAWGAVSLALRWSSLPSEAYAPVTGILYHPRNRYLSTLISWFVLPLVTLWCVRRASLSEQGVAVLFRIVIALGTYLALTAALEHYELWQLVFPRYVSDPGVGIHWGRARGPFGNAAVLGAVLAVIYLVTLFYINHVRAWLPLRGILALIGVATYFTYTRSAWLTLAVSLVPLAACDEKLRRHSVAIAAVLLIVYASGVCSKFSLEQGTLFTTRYESVDNRSDIVKAELAMLAARPLLGFGFGSFEGGQVWSAATSESYRYFDRVGRWRSAGEGNHNAFLGVMVELGALGAVPYALSWFFLLKSCWNVARSPDRRRSFWGNMAVSALGGLMGYLVGVQFFDPRYFGLMNCLVVLMPALACAAAEKDVEVREVHGS